MDFTSELTQISIERERLVPSLLSRSLYLEINRRLSTESSYQNVLDFFFASIEDLLPCDRISIALLEGPNEHPVLNLRWLRSKAPVNYMNLCYTAEVSGSSLQGVLSSGVPRILNDLEEYYKQHPNSISTQLVLKDGVKSNLTFPLEAGGKKIGVVFFSSFKKSTYTQYHIETLSEIAEELAMIVNQMRTVQELQAQKEITRNMNMIIHDLKSPLGTVKGFVDLAEDESWFAVSLEARNFFKVVRRNLGVMSDLLNDLLVNAELNSHQDVFVSAPVNLDDFFDECVAMVKEMSKGKKINLHLSRLHTVKMVRFDPRQIARVVQNLISNVLKYSKEPIEIALALKNDEKFIIFSVKDNGQGIAENEISKLFHDFGKTSARPVNGETSTGLGLSIVKKIIEQHGGNISVSSHLGEGSLFTFSIPLVRI